MPPTKPSRGREAFCHAGEHPEGHRELPQFRPRRLQSHDSVKVESLTVLNSHSKFHPLVRNLPAQFAIRINLSPFGKEVQICLFSK